MNIIFAVSDMGPGGSERVAGILSNAWVSTGHTVTLVATFSGRVTCHHRLSDRVGFRVLSDVLGVQRKTLRSRAARLLALRAFIRDRSPDVVVSFLPNVNVAVILATLGLRIPTIVAERTDPFAMPLPRLLTWATRLLYPMADAIVVQTETVKRKAAALGFWTRRMHVIPNPIPEGVITQSKMERQVPRYRLVAAGRLSSEKQYHLLIQVFCVLAREFKDWDLWIWGQGPELETLEKQVATSGLAGRVNLPGNIQEPWRMYSTSDLFVCTSEYEGFPNALLEAMARGLACVSFDCPSGPREMSNDGEVAVLVEPDDIHELEKALAALMRDEMARRTLGKRAREFVTERYSLEKVLASWDRLFHQVGPLK